MTPPTIRPATGAGICCIEPARRPSGSDRARTKESETGRSRRTRLYAHGSDHLSRGATRGSMRPVGRPDPSRRHRLHYGKAGRSQCGSTSPVVAVDRLNRIGRRETGPRLPIAPDSRPQSADAPCTDVSRYGSMAHHRTGFLTGARRQQPPLRCDCGAGQWIRPRPLQVKSSAAWTEAEEPLGTPKLRSTDDDTMQ